MAKGSPIIQVKNLTREYRIADSLIYALKGVSLEVKEGTYNMLYGPSGSGKTTLLNLMGFVDKPTEGEILLEGVDTTKLGAGKLTDFRLKNIGFIFQKFYLLEELNAIENVFLPAIAKDGFNHKAKLTAHHLLDLVGLKDRLEHKPAQLSEGERQRIAIARSLINEPKLLLCDEPTASLDAENGRIIMELISRINKEKGVTIFLVTHDEAQLKYANKVFHIRDGEITDKKK